MSPSVAHGGNVTPRQMARSHPVGWTVVIAVVAETAVAGAEAPTTIIMAALKATILLFTIFPFSHPSTNLAPRIKSSL